MAGSHAGRTREPGQAGNRAAISVCSVVPWQTRPPFEFVYGIYGTCEEIQVTDVR